MYDTDVTPVAAGCRRPATERFRIRINKLGSTAALCHIGASAAADTMRRRDEGAGRGKGEFSI